MLSQSDESGAEDIQSLLKNYLKEKYQKPGNVFLALVQRLDRPASGLMVLARTSKAASRLSEQIRKRTIGKGYLTVVDSVNIKAGRVTHFLLKDEKRKKALVYSREIPGTQKAVLEVTHLETAGVQSLLSIGLQTGRFHQIRAQLSALGMPIAGDYKYGARKLSGNIIGLFCNQLNFQHPTRKESIVITAKPPHTEPWDRFVSPF